MGVSRPAFTSAFRGAGARFPPPPRRRGSVGGSAHAHGADGEVRSTPGRQQGGGGAYAHAQGGGVPEGGKEALPSAPLWLRSDRMRRPWLAALLFLLLFLVVPVFAFKLNVPKVLLLFSRELWVPFGLEAEGGCYSWRAGSGMAKQGQLLLVKKGVVLRGGKKAMGSAEEVGMLW